ncbi:hypothetical protein GCM10027429_35220 [Marivirga atlantica]|jgi:hypothetical protein|uniref:Uncharacterized protein n=2 Tax=Marivirga atlantica TaxID=1548457 RepID=A0A937AJ34_9BACT|nr:hypothetical protein [Marivirga atlantica]
MTTEQMILGELSIFSKEGIALKTEVAESTSVFRDHDRLKQDRYLFNFDTNCNFNEIELNEPIPNLPIHPLDIEINGDYLTGSFKDSGYATGPYKVKLWLMIEEKPELLKND